MCTLTDFSELPTTNVYNITHSGEITIKKGGGNEVERETPEI